MNQPRRLLYSATGADGRPVHGYVLAASLAAARRQLAADGLDGIRIHDDPALVPERTDLAGLDPRTLARTAAIEAALRADPTFSGFLRQALRASAPLIAVGGALVLWGIVGRHAWATAAGTLVALALPAWSLWTYRHAARYDALQRACALGQQAHARALAARLRPLFKAPEMAFDLAVREACLRAADGDLAGALAEVEAWRAPLDASSPGVFDSRCSAIHFAARDTAGYRDAAQRGYERAPANPLLTVDHALAEARCGDAERAVALVAALTVDDLPVCGDGFLAWVRGLATARHDAGAAVPLLTTAVDGLAAQAANPALWTALALCAGDLAGALVACGRGDEARPVLAPLWPVLAAHGEPALVASLAPWAPGPT